MKNYTKYVDVFHGNGTIDLPNPEGIASTWHFIKGLTGNTHPGAVLPFGKYSVCAYSGGYSSGYGINMVNSGEKIKKLTDTLRIKGFSHFQNSGTGAVGIYYNYAVFKPYINDDIFGDYGARNEHASPGYYSVTLEEINILCELTVTKNIVYHRYTFNNSNGYIKIDFTNDGLYKTNKNLYSSPTSLKTYKLSEHELVAEVTLQGVDLYFYVSSEDGEFNDDCTFKCDAITAEIKLAVSAKSVDKAREYAINETLSFDEAKINADRIWNDALSRIEVSCDDDNELKIFYSNLYHTLVKPCDWDSDSFLYDDAPFVVDFITLWDMYKTQLPLLFTLYNDISIKIVETYRKLAEKLGFFPHTFMLSDNFNIEAKQARMLAEYMLCDAYWRGIDSDWDEILELIEKDIFRSINDDFFNSGCEKTTHTLDIAEVFTSVAKISKDIGNDKLADKLLEYSDKWIDAFDLSNGLLRKESDYYEGNHWNYSFRPMHDMDKRIGLCESKQAFIDYLDKFFGYTYADDVSGRFEGFNNETDMETPYAYHYVGEHDKLSEIIHAGDKYMFRTSRGMTGSGGIPGNNDSGGLSSCYLWNMIGIFPVSGQDLMIIGLPKFKQVKLKLSNDKEFIIRRHGDGIYIKSVLYNGTKITDFELSVSDMMNGGELDLYMTV